MSRSVRLLVAALAVGAVVAPGASASQDLRSPDARDAASAITRELPSAVSVDLRSPDTRDAALARTGTAPATMPPKITARGSSRFDWASAAIGAGALALLLLTAAGVTTVARHLRRPVAT